MHMRTEANVAMVDEQVLKQHNSYKFITLWKLLK